MVWVYLEDLDACWKHTKNKAQPPPQPPQQQQQQQQQQQRIIKI